MSKEIHSSLSEGLSILMEREGWRRNSVLLLEAAIKAAVLPEAN